MPSHEHRRSRRQAPVDPRPPEEVALGRAIMLARVLRWREEWQAEMAARRGDAPRKPNGRAAAPQNPRRNDDAGRFAGAVARNELGRFYWSDAQQDVLIAARNGCKAKQKPRKARPE
jgi:hypothetical protein